MSDNCFADLGGLAARLCGLATLFRGLAARRTSWAGWLPDSAVAALWTGLDG